MQLKWCLWGGVLVVLVVYFYFNPASSPLFPKCPFLLLTTLKCPGCGSQRAIHQLLNLHLFEAFRLNALLVLSIPVLLWLFAVEVLRKKRPSWYAATHSPRLIWVVLIVIILWWIFRNILNC